MITKLELTNFRKHETLVVDFAQGINVIRAANEGGKTTLTEGIAYAMFGTKALRTSLDDAVTLGRDTKSLKAAVSLQNGADYYTFTRSKGGAEVLKNGTVFVTGQNEVSNFAAQLLGADAVTGAKLMLAGQNGIRGALEEGPKALSQLIEDLAGFSTFDQILEAASQKLALGSPALLEERLKGAEATLEAATAALPESPDEAVHTAEVERMTADIDQLQASVQPLQKKAGDLTTQHREASALFLARTEKERAAKQAGESVDAAKRQVETLRDAAAVEVDTSQIPLFKAQIAEAEDFEARKAAYEKFKVLPSGKVYGADAEQFEADAKTNAEKLRATTDTILDVRGKIADLQRQRINHDTCDKCGQDVTHLASVKETNLRVDAEIAELQPKLDAANAELSGLTEFESTVTAVRSFAVKLRAALRGLEDYIELDESVYPATAKWKGLPPTTPIPHAPRDELAAIEARVKAVEAAKAKLELALEQQLKAEQARDAADAALAATDAPDAAEIMRLTEERDKALVEVQANDGRVLIAQQTLKTLEQSFAQSKQLWSSAQARITDAQQTIAACKADLDSLAFNNELVKRLRAIRPLIADKLWATVLSSVSVMFSQMRGTPSIVTKGKAGFAVNDQAIESLSGSTLDILGLALRCSLLHAFIPHCSLLVLDEVAASMDDDRTSALLGFISGAGFDQVLFITHETISESVADNVIEL